MQKNTYWICRHECSYMIAQMKIFWNASTCNASVLHEDANANVGACNANVLHEDANANVDINVCSWNV